MSTTSARSSWLPFLKRNPYARVRLFCFPYAGSGSSLFYPWLTSFPPEIEVCPVQLPGREQRLPETPFTDCACLVQVLAEVLVPHLTLPFAFFGCSMGALISFELARQLQQTAGLHPIHLFVAACADPCLPRGHEPIHRLPYPQFREGLRRLEGTLPEVLDNDELIQLLEPALRADFTLSETYTCRKGEPLSCPITAFGGVRDPYVSQEALADWQHHTTSFFNLHMFNAGHFLIREVHSSLVQLIGQNLGRQKGTPFYNIRP